MASHERSKPSSDNSKYVTALAASISAAKAGWCLWARSERRNGALAPVQTGRRAYWPGRQGRGAGPCGHHADRRASQVAKAVRRNRAPDRARGPHHPNPRTCAWRAAASGSTRGLHRGSGALAGVPKAPTTARGTACCPREARSHRGYPHRRGRGDGDTTHGL
jgi:hypothetical protein